MRKILLTFISMLFVTSLSMGQSGVEINDVNFKFKFSLPADWKERQVEETVKKDAISYSFDKNDGKVAIMVLAFKVNEVKNLNDFIYTLEKDLTLNIPKRDGDYSDFDQGNYDGRSAKYKDTEFTEVIYFYRTKVIDGENFTYLLRFITPTSNFNSSLEVDISKIAGNFAPVLP
ncbi:MAG: hypothetical protein IPL53_24425 [Ignavibacteria bacterium]|nr:hypothetical protein [Ignavibacteria bacterium]